jgi:hypothetical protein
MEIIRVNIPSHRSTLGRIGGIISHTTYWKRSYIYLSLVSMTTSKNIWKKIRNGSQIVFSLFL